MSKSKSNSISKSGNSTIQGQDSLIGIFARVFWSLIGNIVLCLFIVKIFQKAEGFSLFDIYYWVIVFTLILVRYCDIKYLKGVTAEGLPATMEHWKKYAKYLLMISVGLWMFSHIVSFLKK